MIARAIPFCAYPRYGTDSLLSATLVEHTGLGTKPRWSGPVHSSWFAQRRTPSGGSMLASNAWPSSSRTSSGTRSAATMMSGSNAPWGQPMPQGQPMMHSVQKPHHMMQTLQTPIASQPLAA